jgi:hypothetical protein
MIKYITIINDSEITLNLMGRKKTFKNKEEVHGDAYTNAYPQYFKKIGEIKGYSNYLAVPTFIPDPIEDFIEKEKHRKTEKKLTIKRNIGISEVDIEEIASDIEDAIEEKYDIDINSEDIEDILDAKFEIDEEDNKNE